VARRLADTEQRPSTTLFVWTRPDEPSCLIRRSASAGLLLGIVRIMRASLTTEKSTMASMPESGASDRDALLAIHASQRRAHYERDPELLFRHAAEKWTYVRDGRVEQLSHSQLVEQFRATFSGVQYHEWEDVVPPRVDISNDGTLAVMVEHVRIRLSRTNEDGSHEELTGIYAGATVYRRDADEWRSTINIATFER
jgi:hypothetical protein